MNQKNYNYYFIPAENDDENQQLIAILDCSGSISPYWYQIAVCYNSFSQTINQCKLILFDSNVRISDNKEILEYRIYHNELDGTSFTNVFIVLNDIIKQIDHKNLTILFISDGLGEINEDLIKKNLDHVENCNFICVGVGRQFPQSLAKSLRNMYHTGFSGIPEILLVDVDNISLKKNRDESLYQLFELEFKQVKCFMEIRKSTITSPCNLFPWDAVQIAKIWSGNWVCNQEKVLRFKNFILEPTKPSQQMIISLGMYWISTIKQLSLECSVDDISLIAINELERLRQLIPFYSEQKIRTFAQRINIIQQISFEDIIQQLKQFAKGYTLYNLNVYDNADRMKIGTYIGKYHMKAIKFAGLSIDEFNKNKKQLIQDLKHLKFENNEGERSLITLQNQKEILQEKDLINGLQNCRSQYALVTAFPIIGYGLQVERCEGSRINPFLVKVLSLVKVHTYLDSVSLIEKQNHTYRFIVGQKEEVVNCILPLFDEKDTDLRPFYTSQLFHTIMTFVVCENADVCFEHAYAALLSCTLLYLIKQPKSEWSEKMISQINSSYIQVYEQLHQNYNNQLISDTAMTLTNDKQIEFIKSTHILQGYLSLSAMKNKLPKYVIQKITNHLIIETIAGLIKKFSEKYQFNLFFNIKYQQVILDKKIQEILDIFYYCYDQNTLNSEEKSFLINQIINQVVEERQWQLKFQFNQEKFAKIERKITSLNFPSIKQIYEYFMDEQLEQENLIYYFFHLRYQRQQDRAQNPLNENLEEIKQKCIQMKIDSLKKDLSQLCRKQLFDKKQN